MKNNFYNQFKKSVEELKKLVNPHGYFWSCNTDCDTYPEDFISKEKQTFIDIADREIERLVEIKKELHPEILGDKFLNGKFWGTQDVMEYWKEQKELITNHK